MLAMQSWKLLGHVATSDGMPVPVTTFFSGQSKARENMEVAFRLYSRNYPGYSKYSRPERLNARTGTSC
jgi:hypothetical protein